MGRERGVAGRLLRVLGNSDDNVDAITGSSSRDVVVGAALPTVFVTPNLIVLVVRYLAVVLKPVLAHECTYTKTRL